LELRTLPHRAQALPPEQRAKSRPSIEKSRRRFAEYCRRTDGVIDNRQSERHGNWPIVAALSGGHNTSRSMHLSGALENAR
jgi:hypothetical protein